MCRNPKLDRPVVPSYGCYTMIGQSLFRGSFLQIICLQVMKCSYCCYWISSLLCPSYSLVFFLTCLCSCLLGPPASQGAPLLECRCCHCHTCTTHRPSFLPLHSVSPGVQVLLFPFLYSTCNHHTSAYTPIPHPSLLLVVVAGGGWWWWWGAAAHLLPPCFLWFNTSTMNVLLIPLLSHHSSSSNI